MTKKQREWKNYKRRGLLQGDRETEKAKNAFKHKAYVTDITGHTEKKELTKKGERVARIITGFS